MGDIVALVILGALGGERRLERTAKAGKEVGMEETGINAPDVNMEVGHKNESTTSHA